MPTRWQSCPNANALCDALLGATAQLPTDQSSVDLHFDAARNGEGVQRGFENARPESVLRILSLIYIGEGCRALSVRQVVRQPVEQIAQCIRVEVPEREDGLIREPLQVRILLRNHQVRTVGPLQ